MATQPSLAITWTAEADGRIETVERPFLDSLGLNLEDVRASGWLVRVPEKDRSRAIEIWQEGMRSGQPWSLLCYLTDHRGETHRFLIKATPELDGSGGVRCWDGILVELENLAHSDSNSLERQVEEKTAALNTATREMEAFTYSVSHDLRGPLRSIMSASMMLMEDYGDKLDSEARGHLERQASAARKLNKLIDDILQLSRLGRNELARTELDLSEVARAAAQEVGARYADRNPDFQIQEGLTAHADPKMMSFVLTSLFDNACKFQAEGNQPKVRFGLRSDGESPIYFVEDNGIGLDMEFAEKVFLPFERLVRDTDYPGTGIGLAAVKRVIERHGGKVWVLSVPNEGTAFMFTLSEVEA